MIITLTDRIEESLRRGRLNYNEIKEIVKLDKLRHEADESDDEDSIKKLHSLIKGILDRADLSPSERLTLANNERKQ